jgi:regulatory protein
VPTNPPPRQDAEVDRADAVRDRALIAAHEWLQRHGAAEGVGVASQSVQPSEGLDANSAPAPARAPQERSRQSDDDDADAEWVARTIALRKLRTRACTRHELDQALRAKNVPSSVKDAVLDRLEEVGLVDDGAFAADWVASRQQRRHLSRRALRRELEAKGVERSDIDRAVNSVDRNAELTSARDLAERRRVATSGLAHDVQYRRLAGLLSRRGFDAAVITRVLRDVLRE